MRAVTRLRPEKVVGEWDRRIELQSVGLGPNASASGLIAAADGGRSF